MRLLLDTHALLWWLDDRPDLAPQAREAITTGQNDVLVSVASAWEIVIKSARGRLRISGDLRASFDRSGMAILPITLEHALAVGSLPLHHKDPFDRMLIAQATLEGLTVVTRDPQFELYGVPLLKA